MAHLDKMVDLTLEDDSYLAMDVLPRIHPKFFVPRLADRPQNPIMDTLNSKVATESRNSPFQSPLLPTELAILLTDSNTYRPPSRHDLWVEAATRSVGHTVCQPVRVIERGYNRFFPIQESSVIMGSTTIFAFYRCVANCLSF